MKHTWLGAVFASLLLSGCGGMIYGSENARVVDRNVPYGQPVDFGGQGNMQPPPQQGGFNFNGGYAGNGQPVPPPVNAGNGYGFNNGQPMRPQTGQPPVNAPVAANVPPPAQQTQVQAASPYQPAAPTIAKAPAAAPGWGAPADQPKVTPAPNPNQPGAAAIRDAVKEAPKVAVADPAAAANNNKRQALRPNAGSEPAAVPPPVETRVASNTPEPAAAAAPKAEGETAVSALLKKASGSLGKGDLGGAAAYLENAQRLDPKNSKILYDIANIRYHQGRYKEAESMASRAVQTGGSNAMLKKSWSLISNSRNKLGDSQGAVQAATKAASY